MNSPSNHNKKTYPNTLAQKRIFCLMLIEQLYPLGVSIEAELSYMNLPTFVATVLQPTVIDVPKSDDTPKKRDD